MILASKFLDSAVEVGLRYGLIEHYIFVCADRNVSVGVELSGFLCVDFAQFFLLLIV